MAPSVRVPPSGERHGAMRCPLLCVLAWWCTAGVGQVPGGMAKAGARCCGLCGPALSGASRAQSAPWAPLSADCLAAPPPAPHPRCLAGLLLTTHPPPTTPSYCAALQRHAPATGGRRCGPWAAWQAVPAACCCPSTSIIKLWSSSTKSTGFWARGSTLYCSTLAGPAAGCDCSTAAACRCRRPSGLPSLPCRRHRNAVSWFLTAVLI